MSSSGLGRGLGSLLEPKHGADAKRPTSRGFGALIGESSSTSPVDVASQPVGVSSAISSSSPSISIGASAGPSLGLTQAPATPSGNNARSNGLAGELKSPKSAKTGPVPLVLLGADAILVGLSGWILISPTWRGHREAVVLGVILMTLATTLGVLATLDRRR